MEYDTTYGTPTHWQHVPYRALKAAVIAFVNHMIDKQNMFDIEQFALVRQYGIEYLAAPCWEWAAERSNYPQGKVEIVYLREMIAGAETAQDIADWIEQCIKRMGVDPL